MQKEKVAGFVEYSIYSTNVIEYMEFPNFYFKG